MDELVRDAILNRKTSHEIRHLARESGEMLSLLEDGIAKAAAGRTTIQEIVRMLPRLDRPRPLEAPVTTAVVSANAVWVSAEFI